MNHAACLMCALCVGFAAAVTYVVMLMLACRQKVNGRRYNVHEPELDYGVDSDEDWEEPADGELLTVCTAVPTILLMS